MTPDEYRAVDDAAPSVAASILHGEDLALVVDDDGGVRSTPRRMLGVCGLGGSMGPPM